MITLHMCCFPFLETCLVKYLNDLICSLGADPMSGVTPGSTNPSGHHLTGLPHSYPSHPLLANRDREYLHPDLIRAYGDQALAHQVSQQYLLKFGAYFWTFAFGKISTKILKLVFH